MQITLSEHKCIKLIAADSEPTDGCALIKSEVYQELQADDSKEFNSSFFFKIQKQDKHFTIQADYCIGLDWIVKNKLSLYVAPKINAAWGRRFEKIADKTEDDPEIKVLDEQAEKETWQPDVLQSKELDYIRMLLMVMTLPEAAKHTGDLVRIFHDQPVISISSQEDKLTPFLIVQFLQLLKQIVRKGLRKSYYKVQENLNNRVKGKILVGQHLKQNVFKNRLTTTRCEYQVFGVDHAENRFLKKVLCFAASYVEQNSTVFKENLKDVMQLIHYTRPAFEQIGEAVTDHDLQRIKANPFFKEYKEAIRIGHYILKRFAYNITQTAQEEVSVPPFWIDMPKLFELYVYQKLLSDNPDNTGNFHFQFPTPGNVLDVLYFNKELHQAIVIDAKYKLQYASKDIHQDIRQVSGYARLHQVRHEAGITDDTHIPCLIVYPDLNAKEQVTLKMDKLLDQPLKAYYKVYKVGIPLPLIDS